MSTLYNRLNSSRNRTRRRCAAGMPLSSAARIESEIPVAAAVTDNGDAPTAEPADKTAPCPAAISRLFTVTDAVFASLSAFHCS